MQRGLAFRRIRRHNVAELDDDGLLRAGKRAKRRARRRAAGQARFSLRFLLRVACASAVQAAVAPGAAFCDARRPNSSANSIRLLRVAHERGSGTGVLRRLRRSSIHATHARCFRRGSSAARGESWTLPRAGGLAASMSWKICAAGDSELRRLRMRITVRLITGATIATPRTSG